MRIRIAATLVLFSLAGAQETHMDPAGKAEKPAMLMAGFGNIHHPIATEIPEAQQFFDQGLALIYAFNHDEAARSFRKAMELDPKAAMPAWGVALALGPNINDYMLDQTREKAAFDAAAHAAELAAAGSSAEEKALTTALRKRYSVAPRADLHACALSYANAMREVKNKYPDDLDAATLFAESMMDLRPWKLWMPDGRPAPGTEEIVDVLRSVMKRDPDHVGANHYFIHTVEASPHPEDAIPSAGRLGNLTPAAGHLVHMPGHIFLRTGDFHQAALSNELAAEADRKYFEATGAQGMYQMYYAHNLTFICLAHAATGEFAASMKAAETMLKSPAPLEMSGFFGTYRWFTLLQFHRWDDILKLTPPPATELPIVQLLWHATFGEALAGVGKVAEAEAELKSLEAIRLKLTGQPPEMSLSFTNPAPAIAAVAKYELAARIAAAKKQDAAELLAWRQAVAAQDALAYDEPPAWYRPVRQSLGATLIQAGRFAEAEKVFRADLERNPRNGRSLFGLMTALEKQNKDAWEIRRDFQTAWQWADGPLRIGDL
jgi:tetratricopeptide (TPR) repeat protein